MDKLTCRRKMVVCVIALVGIFLSVSAGADEIEDAIQEALQQYKNGAYSEAMEGLNYASQLIGQKKGDELQSFLPGPLEGWTAEDASSQAMGAAVFGGSVTAERRYFKENASVNVKIVTDSPMLQGMMMMFANPMIATSDDGKLEKIAGQKAIVKYNEKNKDGTITIVAANRFLVTVEGSDVSIDDLKNYAAAMDYKKMAAIP